MRNLHLHINEFLQTTSFYILVHVIRQVAGGHGTRTFRVFEHESRVEHNLFHQGKSLLIIILAFIVEPDEHVRGNSTIGDDLPDGMNPVKIPFTGIFSVHVFQYGITPGLEG